MRAASLLVLLVALLSTSSRADGFGHGWGSGCDASCETGVGVTMGLIEAADLGIVVANLLTMVHREYVATGWGVLEAAWGVGHLALGGVVTALGAVGLALNDPGAGGRLALGLVLLGEGLFFLIVLIDSAVRFVRHLRHRDAWLDSPLVPVVAFAPGRGGGGAALFSWQF
jgi:hypothetical protein